MGGLIQKLFDFTNKTAVVTGSGGGIGRAIAEALADAGADIVMAELDADKLKNTAAAIRREYGVNVVEANVDVQEPKQVETMVARSLDASGYIDILVNNAGMGIHKRPQDMTIEEWDYNINVNLRSVFVCSKAVFEIMKKQGGKIVNIGSMYARFGAAAVPAYSASKGGVVQLTKSLAIAWAPYNIQVNAVSPGFINTDLSAAGKRDVPNMEKNVVARTPAGRWGEPEDCAGAALFLASRAADFITGVSLPVDGGYSVM
ncbi:MAG: SDR family oxidoreductase [Desulfobacteraceae bacterium]|nr:SDR family oxidoreductase [Desulfobacteraceae bacterium]